MKKSIIIIGMIFLFMLSLVSADIFNYDTEYLFEQNNNDNIGNNDLSGSIPYSLDSVNSVYSADFRGHSNTTTLFNSSILDYGSEFTITGWIKTNETSGNYGVLGYSLDVNNFGTFQITYNCLKLVHQDFNPSYQNSIDQMCGLTNETFKDWTFFALRIGQSSATTNLYVNGVTYTTGGSPNYNRLGTANFWVGGASGLNFNGQLDDIRIYRELVSDSDLYLIENNLNYCQDNDPNTLCECNSDLTNWEDNAGKDYCYILPNTELTLDTNTYNLSYLNSHRIYLEENASIYGNNSIIYTSSYLPFYMKDNTYIDNLDIYGEYDPINTHGHPTYLLYGSSSFKDQTIKNVNLYDSQFGLAFFGGGQTIHNAHLTRAGWRTYGGNLEVINASCVGTPSLTSGNNFGVEFGLYGGYSPYESNIRVTNFYQDCYTYYGEALEIYPYNADISDIIFDNYTFNNTANNYGIHIYGDVYSNAFVRDMTIKNSHFATNGLTNNGINTNLDGNNTYHDNFFITNLNQGTGGDYEINFNTQESSVTFTNITSGTTQVNDVIISETFVYAEDSFNKPASISFNVNNEFYEPFRNGYVCNATYCSNIVNDGNTLTFDVSGFSNYTYGIASLGNIEVSINDTSTITLNETPYYVFFNWTESFSPTNDTLVYRVFIEKLLEENISNGLTELNYTYGFTEGLNGNYNVFVRVTDGNYLEDFYSDDSLTFCTNDWELQSGICIDEVMNYTYIDSNNCPIEYNKPSDYQENCKIAEPINEFQIILGVFIIMVVLTAMAFMLDLNWLHIAVALLSAVFVTTYIMPSIFEANNGFHAVIVLVFIVIGGINGHLSFKNS